MRLCTARTFDVSSRTLRDLCVLFSRSNTWASAEATIRVTEIMIMTESMSAIILVTNKIPTIQSFLFDQPCHLRPMLFFKSNHVTIYFYLFVVNLCEGRSNFNAPNAHRAWSAISHWSCLLRSQSRTEVLEILELTTRELPHPH